jgi:predicted glycoside hydrolase/deacetylase ChbG (UPF0249 family)
MTQGVNRAIAESHANGIVTSTTLMATGHAFAEAVAIAEKHPRLAVGCHISLVQGSPLLPAPSLPTLASVEGSVEAPAGGRRLRSGFLQLALAARRSRLDPEEIVAEATAQIRKLQSAGIAVSHFDTHKHVHIIPEILRPLLRAARECGIRALRNPFEPPGVLHPLQFASFRMLKRYPVVQALRSFAPAFRRLAKEAGMITPQGAVGIAITGSLNERELERMIRGLPEGDWELVCHPAFIDSELLSLSSLRSGEDECRALTSANIRRALEESGVSLITFADLAAEE